MGESVKAMLASVAAVLLLIGVMVWVKEPDMPEWGIWVSRLVLPAVAIAIFVFLIALMCRKSKVPDFLRKRARDFFERKGFCFALENVVREGHSYVLVWFENRYDQPCDAAVELGGAYGWRGDRKADGFFVDCIECGPAAFGVALVPFPVPAEHQGKKLKFKVGADVLYPDGRGQQLRYKRGFGVTGSAGGTGDRKEMVRSARWELSIDGPVTDAATWVVVLPEGVATEPPPDAGIKVATLWKLGDPIPEGGVDSPDFDKRAALLAQE